MKCGHKKKNPLYCYRIDKYRYRQIDIDYR